ncbi:hypothetical protein Tco_1216238 [Tanacetum coccineum]
MSLSLAENVIVAGANNRSPMLDKSNYSSWASRMLLYIKGKPNGKLLIDFVLNGPFQFGTVLEPETKNTPATVRPQTYTNLTDEEKLRESVDITEKNIVLQGLPQDIYNLVNHNEHAKQIWDRVKLLIQGSELSLQERESKLKHEALANEVRLTRQRYPDQIALVANSPSCLNSTQYYPQLSSASQQYYPSPALQPPAIQQPLQPSFQELDTKLVVPTFNLPDDPVANLNKLMTFVITIFPSRYPPTNNQPRTSSNPRNQATIQDGRVTVQTIQGRQIGCTKPKRPKNSTWFKEKMLLIEALELGACLDPKQLVFLVDNRDTITPVQASQEIPIPVAFQTDDLDSFHSDCDDAPSAKAVLMANLSLYDSDVLSEVPLHDTHIQNDMSYQETKTPVVQSTSSLARQDALIMHVIEEMSSQVAKCNKVQQENMVVNETLTVELERYNEQVKLLEQRQKFNLNDKEKYIDGQLRQETEVAKCSVDKKYFKIEKKELSLDIDRLLEHILCQDVMNVVMHNNNHHDNVLPANHNFLVHDNSALDRLKHETDRLMKLLISQDLTELARKNDMIDKAVYNELSNRCFRLENQCISLEIKLHQNKESFQNQRPPLNQNAQEFKEFFTINKLHAQLEANNVSIAKLKEHIAILKGKNIVESVQNVHNSNVVTSKDYKLDLPPLSPFIKNNMVAHVHYLKHTQANADILHEIIKDAREIRPLDSNLDSAYKFVTHIQELLVYVSATCPSTKHVSDELVAVTPLNRTRGVRFENDQIAKIIGYGDYQLRNVTISRVYYVEGLGHNFFSVGQFCDSNLEVAFRKHTCYIQNSDDADLLSGSRDTNLYTISLDNMLKSFPICLLSKASKTKSCSIFLWSEGVSTACYTQNRSLIRIWYNKAPYELLHDKKPDLSHFYVFGSLCYPTNDSEDLGKLKAKADIASEQFCSGPAPQVMTSAPLSSGLVPDPIPQPPYVPPTKNDWDLLFQPMFDEFLNSPPSVVSQVLLDMAQRPADPTGLPVSTSLEHDAPSASTPSTPQQHQSPTISQGVAEQIENTYFDDPCHETLNENSVSQGANVQKELASFEYTPVQNILNRDSSLQESSSNV